ncbi:IS1634 family transposase [Globicatella sanguinis]
MDYWTTFRLAFTYDGFYCVATNLETDVEDIIAVNQRRWEIEESFKIMKTEFKSRPIYLSKENRIKAHFLTCFLSLLIFRMLEQRIQSQHTICEIIQTLRSMKLTKLTEDAYLPHYTRTNVTDSIHQASGFRTDYQLLTKKKLKTIEKNIRERK